MYKCTHCLCLSLSALALPFPLGIKYTTKGLCDAFVNIPSAGTHCPRTRLAGSSFARPTHKTDTLAAITYEQAALSTSDYMCVRMCVCGRVGNSPAFRWLCWNGCISACATVRACLCCLLPAACCRRLLPRRHTDTFPHVMPVVSIVCCSHTHTHTRTHASVHCIMGIVSVNIVLLRCCTVSSVHSRPKRKKNKNKITTKTTTFVADF